jgi:hypothetical protein
MSINVWFAIKWRTSSSPIAIEDEISKHQGTPFEISALVQKTLQGGFGKHRQPRSENIFGLEGFAIFPIQRACDLPVERCPLMTAF